MLQKFQPEVGLWYQELDSGCQFTVVAIDDITGMIETQLAEGDVEELEQESWYKLSLQPMETPEYFSKYGYDEDSNEDYDTGSNGNNIGYAEEPWFGSLNSIEDRSDIEADW